MAPSLPDPTASRREAILRVAAAVFLRYGYRKTSMEDLARAAGVSRQGLYLHFSTKEAIFRESVIVLTVQSLDAVRTALARTSGTIEDRLLTAFVDLASQPDGDLVSGELLDDLMQTAAELAGPIVAAFDDDLRGELARALRSSGVAAAWKSGGLSANDLTRHLLAASRGIKQTTRTVVDYREQMRVAVRLVCRGHVVVPAG